MKISFDCLEKRTRPDMLNSEPVDDLTLRYAESDVAKTKPEAELSDATDVTIFPSSESVRAIPSEAKLTSRTCMLS